MRFDDKTIQLILQVIVGISSLIGMFMSKQAKHHAKEAVAISNEQLVQSKVNRDSIDKLESTIKQQE